MDPVLEKHFERLITTYLLLKDSYRNAPELPIAFDKDELLYLLKGTISLILNDLKNYQ